MAGKAWHGEAWQGEAWQGKANHGRRGAFMKALLNLSPNLRLKAADWCADLLSTAQCASVTYEQRQAIAQDLRLAPIIPAAESRAARNCNKYQERLPL